ncbi:hypothetical protein GU926_00425 [Nibribacter ruber]|uniref:TraB/GumN family protein n=1 Tax=Nibribacter ruber TaxID=2698458 RepID=A0A6P1NUP5_9BACT|nr:DUF5694 domain-containing protein [Nibribacter ruber]QHL85989.1 hypothetical protein GU926_00425 [Nibribacter ruber]
MPFVFHRSFVKAAFSLSLLVLASPLVKAQDSIEILVVASSHSNTGTPDKYRPIIDKLKNFRPDMVFGETLSPQDEREAQKQNYWGTANSLKRLAYFEGLNGTASKNVDKQITKGYLALQQNEKAHQKRMQLARDLVLSQDRGNAEYQFFVLTQYQMPNFNPADQARFTKMFGPLDSLKKVGMLREKSEYHKIFFPLVYELKHPKIYAMDCQKYDAQWTKAWNKAGTLMQEMEAKAKADSTSSEAQTLQQIETFSKNGVAELDAKKYKNYEYMNNPLYARLNNAWNFYGGPEFYGYPGFPTEAIKEMVYWFDMRNQGICENVLKQAQAQHAKRVVVAVGAAHRKGMEEIFNTMPNVKVVHYLDI